MTAVPVTLSPRHPVTPSPPLPPALILLHSSDPLGQRHGFYLALARAMQARGFTVLTFDLRGYPDSEQPAPEALTMSHLVADVRAAYEALCDTGRADPQRIALYGHSYGAGIVLPALLAGLPFHKAIIHSPPDWNGPRMTDEGAPQRDLFHERFWRYMGLPRPVPLPIFLQLARDLDLLNAIPQLPAGHAPLLLFDGSREGRSLRSFMRTAYARLSPPVDYYTLPGADHFGNTVMVNGRLWVDGRVLETMAEYLRIWLSS